ncbi:hypothetical protein [Streptomyces sp. NPDC017638]|uniref:hypothetical protein n=1 Tax=Streptomyces sp. NPDC017638 TaxID=3365004 RepID=UPI00379228C9
MTHWLAMPVEHQAAKTALPALKYDVPNAVVVRDSRLAYVGITDGDVAEQLLAHADVKILSSEEKSLIELVPGVPVPWESLERQMPELGTGHRRKGAVGLGDLVSALTRRASIPECRSCARRRKGLNRIIIWGWWRDGKLSPQPEG